MKNTVALSLVFALLVPVSAFAEGGGDPQVDKLLPVCQTCHGDKGAKPILPQYPVLAGQHTNYLEHALKDYRSGARKNAIMKGQAANLTDADIVAVAKYFSHQESPLYTFTLPPPVAASAARQ